MFIITRQGAIWKKIHTEQKQNSHWLWTMTLSKWLHCFWWHAWWHLPSFRCLPELGLLLVFGATLHYSYLFYTSLLPFAIFLSVYCSGKDHAMIGHVPFFGFWSCLEFCHSRQPTQDTNQTLDFSTQLDFKKLGNLLKMRNQGKQ